MAWSRARRWEQGQDRGSDAPPERAPTAASVLATARAMGQLLADRLRAGAPAPGGGQPAGAGGRPSQPHFVRTYTEQTRKLLASVGTREDALRAAVGSGTARDFEEAGRAEQAILRYAGLGPDDDLLDVGCGSGRLAVHLAPWLRGSYLGTDVVQELLDQASRACARKDWRFERVQGLTVPAAPDSFSMACAFSVFTHLRHEESYVYLRDILRVLRPGGRLVFSYLEFRVPEHWLVLEANLASIGQDAVLNQFMSIDMVEAFADHLGFELVEAHRADEWVVPPSGPAGGVGAGARAGSGAGSGGVAGAGADAGADAGGEVRSLGQSVAIYRKPG